MGYNVKIYGKLRDECGRLLEKKIRKVENFIFRFRGRLKKKGDEGRLKKGDAGISS